jgi:hypothetical protein
MCVCATEVIVWRSARGHNTRGGRHLVVLHSHHYIRQSSQCLAADTPFLCILVAQLTALVTRSVRQRMGLNQCIIIRTSGSYVQHLRPLHVPRRHGRLTSIHWDLLLKTPSSCEAETYRMIINCSSRIVSNHLPTSVGEFQARTEKSWSRGGKSTHIPVPTIGASLFGGRH